MKKKQNAIVVAKTVKNVQKEKPDEMLATVCEFFGIDPNRDKLAYEIFTEIIVARKENKGVKTIDVTKKAHVTQAAVVYHMNTFMRNGLIIKQGTEYVLRGENLDQTFDELEQDMIRRMRRMRELAKLLDECYLE
jgi:predicted transcriptional regulator